MIGVDVGDGKRKNANALKYGVMVRDVLTSKGTRCTYHTTCPECFSNTCTSGSPCRHESHFLRHYVASADSYFAYAKVWLSPEEYAATIHELGILALQMARLSARTAREGPFDNNEDSGIPHIGIAITRYATALHKRRKALMLALLDRETADYWNGI